MSRIPVREAVIALDREGWLSIEPHRGAFVHGLDENNVRDHYSLLGLLYGLVAERATQRGTDETMTRLRDAQRELSRAVDPHSVLNANDSYLRQLFAMADSPRLASFSRLMAGVIPGNFFERVPGTSEAQKRGIAVVTKAISARDGEQAAACFVELLDRHGDRVIALLHRRRTDQAPEV